MKRSGLRMFLVTGLSAALVAVMVLGLVNGTVSLMGAGIAAAQEAPPAAADVPGQLQKILQILQDTDHRLDVLQKQIDDVMWHELMDGYGVVEKVRIYGPPRWKEKNPTGIGAGNPLKFYAYIFFPRDLNPSAKAPLLVFPHGGVHADFTTYYAHIVRELLAQGYVVVAPEYRGSTGYGKTFYQDIDYGGLEVEDNHACRAYMIENYDFIAADRVGMIGWSHGGLISLMNIFAHPRGYACAFAGVPVSDLVSRLGYLDEGYRKDFSAEYHIGQTVEQNIPEYKRRSPVWNVEKLDTPLLIHTNTNDEDVNVLEVEHLIQALKAADKEFAYEVFQDVPGGHSFDRLDTKQAMEIRLKIYRFLGTHLRPPRPFENLEQLHRAGYALPERRD